MILASYTSPKTLKGLPSKIHGLGFFATKNISKGEIVAIKAGHLVYKDDLPKHKDVIRHSQMQITDDFYVAPLNPEESEGSMLYLNHSCEPNVVVQGQIVFSAYRDIVAGEEITLDYGTLYNDDSVLTCDCGMPSCRGVITGHDWQKTELQQKYGDNFAWFILQKINRIA